jgi:hypothetical protein
MSLVKAPSCVVLGCGKLAAYKYKNKNGDPVYRNFCDKHHRMRASLKLTKKDYCENCDGHLGFLCTAQIVDSCQLQIDHIDGDRYNNDPANYKTLCANCHSLKTKLEKNHSTRYTKRATTTLDDLLIEEDGHFNSLFTAPIGDNNG